MRRSRVLTALTLLSFLLLAPARPAVAQNNRDSLRAGSAAYDRADFAAAARLLAIGLDPSAGPQDAAWANAVHKLTDALLQTGDSASLPLWLTWANRAAPGFAIDTLLFPPRVTGPIRLARAEARPTASDSLVVTSWQFGTSDAAARRGVLRLQRGAGLAFGILENVGTVLPEERRTLAAGNYTVVLTVEGLPPIRVTREVLPGVTTVVGVSPRAAQLAARSEPPVDSTALIGARLSAGGSASCWVARATAWCWGSNAGGLLGGGWTDTVRAPVAVSGGQRFTAISVGTNHACGLVAAGAVYCWGAGSVGQLGNGAATASTVPVAVSGNQSFTAVAAGTQHTCGVSRTGSVFCWGANSSGQLGNRTGDPSNVPVAVATPAGTNFEDIAVGATHTCARTTRGKVFCWGGNSDGQLGIGSTRNQDRPNGVAPDLNFRALVAGASHTCGLLESGRVMCWGANGNGQLGNGSTAAASRPAAISDTTVFTALSAGAQFTCGITREGGAWCWGAGGSGQLGNGRTADSPRPTLVVGGLQMRAVAAGNAHACAMTAEALVWCWGSNVSGQVGTLAGAASAEPVPVVFRPAPRDAPVGLQPRREARDNFADGNLTAGVVWQRDSLAGARLRVDSGELLVGRAGSRGAVGAVGIGMAIRVPARDAAVGFDVRVARNETPGGCGLNCAAFPAIARVRVRNRDYSHTEVWYAYGGPETARRWSASGITVVPLRAPTGEWLRRQRLNILEHAPRADEIVEVWFGGVGTDFEARFDNIHVPSVIIAAVAVTPDTARLARAGDTLRLAAEPRDSAGTAQPWAAVTWSSSDTTVATVSAAGMVTAVGNGTAQIRATAEGVTGVARVTVRIPPPPRARPARRRRP